MVSGFIVLKRRPSERIQNLLNTRSIFCFLFIYFGLDCNMLVCYIISRNRGLRRICPISVSSLVCPIIYNEWIQSDGK